MMSFEVDVGHRTVHRSALVYGDGLTQDFGHDGVWR